MARRPATAGRLSVFRQVSALAAPPIRAKNAKTGQQEREPGGKRHRCHVADLVFNRLTKDLTAMQIQIVNKSRNWITRRVVRIRRQDSAMPIGPNAAGRVRRQP